MGFSKKCYYIHAGCWTIAWYRPQVLQDDLIKWKHFPRYWAFVRGIHRSPVNSPHKGQWRGALMFSLICIWINGWVNTHEAGDLRHHRTHYDVIAMILLFTYYGNILVSGITSKSFSRPDVTGGLDSAVKQDPPIHPSYSKLQSNASRMGFNLWPTASVTWT